MSTHLKKLSNPIGLLNFLSNPKDWYVICASRSEAFTRRRARFRNCGMIIQFAQSVKFRDNGGSNSRCGSVTLGV